MSDAAKIRELLNKTAGAQVLSQAVATLQSQFNMNQLGFEQAANHLKSAVTNSKAKSFGGQSQVSAVNSGKNPAPSKTS